MSLRRLLGVSLLVGAVGWLAIWFQTEPRANFDSLIYHTHALEYAGLPREKADRQSWIIYARYASDREQALIERSLDDHPWRTPASGRWMDFYEMRPMYPALVAAAYPVLGVRAPMAVSAFVTVSYVVLTAAGFAVLFGVRVAAFATAAALLQISFTHWLVFLATDGLAMLLWAGVLVATALHARMGHRKWLVAIFLAVAALAVTRPTGSLAPLVPLCCAALALLARRSIWRRFAAAGAAAIVPAALAVFVQAQLGHPGLADVLQEIPTRHFSLPDIEDPVGYAIRVLRWAIPYRLVPTLLEQPLLVATIAVGLAGLLVRRSWVAAPFLVAALIVPMAWIIHPVWYDAGRVLAPAWVSLNLGIALFGEWALVRWREPIRRTANWATRPGPEVDAAG